MKYITTSAVALSVLMAAAPLAAFAEDSASASVNVQAETHAQTKQGVGDAIRNLFAPAAIRAHLEMNHDASSTSGKMEAHMDMSASTTPGKGKGVGLPAIQKAADGTKARAAGSAEIDARIASLNKMIARLADATRLSADAKASLTTELNAQMTALTALKAQIGTEATTTLKDDVKSITKDFRVYALVLPKAAITAAADRIMTIVAQMETLSGKIATRITAAQTAGADVSAAISAHTDFDMKVADAKLQAQAAVSTVAGLTADAGATTTLEANTAALKLAKGKLEAAQADLKAARADVEIIIKAIKGKGEVKAEATAQ